MPAVFSFDMVKVVHHTSSNAASTGGVLITLQGINLGKADYSSDVLIGNTLSSHTIWVSDSSLVARTDAGVGVHLILNFQSESRNSAPSSLTFSLDAPCLSDTQILQNIPTTGSVDRIISGFNFGSADYTTRIRIAHTVCRASVWSSDSSVECKGASLGNGYGLVRVQIEGLEYAGCGIYYYDFPKPSGILVPNLPQNQARMITVMGSNLALNDVSNSNRISSTAAQASLWISDTSIKCLTSQGSGRSLAIVATAGIQAGSMSCGMSFDSAIVRVGSFSTNLLRTTALPLIVTLVGEALGLSDNTVRIAIGTRLLKQLRGYLQALLCANQPGAWGTAR